MSMLAATPVREQTPVIPEQSFVVRPTTYASYCAISEHLSAARVRMTYHRGRLEFLTLSRLHERLSGLLGRLVEALTEELNIPCATAGSTTLRREDADGGLEPDQCYYLENEPKMRGRDELDLKVDPPPDFAIEVEVSRTAISRMAVYAALGVAEVWRFDGETLHVHQLTPASAYVEVARSPHFPFLRLGEIVNFVRRRHELGETELVRTFRAWVRDQAACGWPLPEQQKC